MNETTQQEKTTQLSSRNEQLNSAAGTKQLNSSVGTKQLNSTGENNSTLWLTRKENKSVLDKQLQEQIKKDIEYYHNILKCVIAVVKYLAIKGLEFRGTEEVFGSPHNDNFIGALELLAEFDPFIREHIEQREL
ncbi:zinc finger MYM-type protein 1 [Trichonephila clavipes]|nr:zinc finger MYM-type protein 1 [Trichonephila clavipes]